MQKGLREGSEERGEAEVVLGEWERELMQKRSKTTSACLRLVNMDL